MSKFLRYTVPSVMGCLVTSLYLVVDGVFIARGVGEAAVAGVTLVLPLTMAFVALSMIFSVGGETSYQSPEAQATSLVRSMFSESQYACSFQ